MKFGIPLFIIAVILYSILAPLNLIVYLTKKVYEIITLKLSFKQVIKDINKVFFSLALAIDHLGNATCGTISNLLFVKNEGYTFGKIKETMSATTGINHLNGTLEKAGIILKKILDFAENIVPFLSSVFTGKKYEFKDHCVSAVEIELADSKKRVEVFQKAIEQRASR
jgi:hypothetical protein